MCMDILQRGRRKPPRKGNQMENLIKIPTRFYEDHLERDLECPEIIKETKTHYWISADDEHLGELHDDADFYAFPYVDARPGDYLWGIVVSARATVKAIEKAVPSLKNGEYYKNKREA